MSKDLENLVSQLNIDAQQYSAEKLLQHSLEKFAGKIAFATSFGAEDQVLADMIYRTGADVQIFTLDTGRLPQETYDVMTATRNKYGLKIEILFPDNKSVEQMVNQYGPNLFYDSIELRKLCCHTRKIEPLKRKLENLDGWICGLRAEQSPTRTGLKRIEYDETFGLIKFSPLADWSNEQIWDYIRKNEVPYNKLHDRGFPSIGCMPCTRAVKDGENIRAGRWWWENPEHKECGLHLSKKKGRA